MKRDRNKMKWNCSRYSVAPLNSVHVRAVRERRERKWCRCGNYIQMTQRWCTAPSCHQTRLEAAPLQTRATKHPLFLSQYAQSTPPSFINNTQRHRSFHPSHIYLPPHQIFLDPSCITTLAFSSKQTLSIAYPSHLFSNLNSPCIILARILLNQWHPSPIALCHSHRNFELAPRYMKLTPSLGLVL